jgi:hypothetical protein
MKIFIYKTLIVVTSAYFLFQFTVGQKLKNYENRIESLLHDKQGRELMFEKIKKEVRTANQKENIFTSEEKELFSKFINKIQKELSIDNTQ